MTEKKKCRNGRQSDLELLEELQDRIMAELREKEINPKVKALLLSGYSIDGKATEILERGCDGFIQKPFDLEQLSRSIRDILD